MELLSFMALLVIPSLKLSDKGLFDGARFEFDLRFGFHSFVHLFEFGASQNKARIRYKVAKDSRKFLIEVQKQHRHTALLTTCDLGGLS